MASLTENTCKIAEIRDDLVQVICDHGVYAPASTKFSGMPTLIKQIETKRDDTSGIWGRPKDWPRIDMIPLSGYRHHVIYLVVRKPPTKAHGLCLNITTADGADWQMTNIGVSNDGRTITAIQGQTAASGSSIDFSFPDEKAPGSIFAIAIKSTTLSDFSNIKCAAPSDLQNPLAYNNAVCLEEVVRMTNGKAFVFADENNFASAAFSGPQHIVIYGSNTMQTYGFRKHITLKLVEFKDDAAMQVSQGNVSPSFYIENPYLACMRDNDVKINYHLQAGPPARSGIQDIDGEIYPLDGVYDLTTGTAFNWETCTYSLTRFFYKNAFMTCVALPAGFGVNSSSVAGMFGHCISLTSVNLPAGFGSKATNISQLFWYCTSITKIVIPAGCGSVATNCSEIFRVCASLQDLEIPEEFGQNAVSTAYCFGTCGNLVNVNRAPAFKISFSLSDNTKLSHESLLNILNTLQTVTTSPVLSLGTANLAKLTDDEKKIATDRGWTLA